MSWFLEGFLPFIHPLQIENNHSSTVTRFRLAEKRMLAIPVSFIIIRIWGTIRFMLYSYNGGTIDTFLSYLQVNKNNNYRLFIK